MRQPILRFVLTVSLILSVGSLAGNIVWAGPGGQLEGCCICFDCIEGNATMMGLGQGSAVCIDVGDAMECRGACAQEGCSSSDFENSTCSAPALDSICGDGAVAPAPASSAFGLMALAALLFGFGAFYLRDRRA